MNEDSASLFVDARMTQAGIRSLIPNLPSDDAELDQWIEQLIKTGDEHSVSALLLTAVAAGRLIDARHLPKAIPLLRNPGDMLAVGTHGHGEVLDALMQTAREESIGWERHGTLLLLIGWLAKCRAPEAAPPQDLIPMARQLARELEPDPLNLLPLFCLAELLDSGELLAVLKSLITPPTEKGLLAILPTAIKSAAEDPLSHLPEHADTVLHEGGTVRRAAAKVRRNDPCPCGSGMKYKRCCYEADQERLRHSSRVAGKTTAELTEDPEPFLTEEALLELRSPKLARLRIDRVPPPLQGQVLERLARFGQIDKLLADWEHIGWREDLEFAWEMCVLKLERMQRADALARLCAVRGWDANEPRLSFSTRALLLKDQPAEVLQQAEANALASLKDLKNTDYIGVAYGLLDSDWPGLGTLIARGAATTSSPLDAMTLFDCIHAARDRLNLTPEDPAEWILDHVYDTPENFDDKERQKFESTKQQLELTTSELARLRGQMTEARAQLDRNERLAKRREDTQEHGAGDTAGASVDTTRDLRRRIENLKAELNSRHREKTALRQELSEAVREAEDLRNRVGSPHDTGNSPTAEVDHEEDSLLAEEPLTQQPPRLPVFQARFETALRGVPASVARSALTLIGRLAAGEPGAFVGTRRLRRNREIQRARVGAAHRLFFRLHADRFEVLDLIARRDLDRWLKQQS